MFAARNAAERTSLLAMWCGIRTPSMSDNQKQTVLKETVPDFFIDVDENNWNKKQSNQTDLKWNKEIEELCLDKLDDYHNVINEIAKHEVFKLNENEKQTLLEHPDYAKHHFGYCLYLRNKYIHLKSAPDYRKLQGNPFRHGFDDGLVSMDLFKRIEYLLHEENQRSQNAVFI